MARLCATSQPARAQAKSLRPIVAGRFPADVKCTSATRPCTALRCAAPPAEMVVERQGKFSPSLLPRPTHKGSQGPKYLEAKYVKLCQFIETNGVVQLPDSKCLLDSEAALQVSRAPECPPVQQQSWWQLSFDEDYGLAAC